MSELWSSITRIVVSRVIKSANHHEWRIHCKLTKQYAVGRNKSASSCTAAGWRAISCSARKKGACCVQRRVFYRLIPRTFWAKEFETFSRNLMLLSIFLSLKFIDPFWYPKVLIKGCGVRVRRSFGWSWYKCTDSWLQPGCERLNRCDQQ
jgi:hypothetical protein